MLGSESESLGVYC